MTINRQLELLKIERECVQRNHDGKCDRDCANCDLVQIDTDLLEMYDEVIKNYEMVIKRRPGKQWVQWFKEHNDVFKEAMQAIKNDSSRKCGW